MVARSVKPIVVIVGETASGKTALAIELAKQFDGEIISADSWTVYKGFDIGTAKPTVEEMAGIPHHLIDVADPTEGFSAGKFKLLAEQALADIHERGKLPILVGGTGLYIDSILYDYSFLPRPSEAVRAELNALSLDALLALAEERGLDTSDIDVRNKRRVIRLIENDGQKPTKQDLREATIVVGVRREATELHERIMRRVDSMVAAGFVDEVRQLGEQYGWDVEPMRAPGYRAFGAYVRGEVSLDAAKERFVLNDLQLAKKQRTWFKRNASINWILNSGEAVALVTTLLNK